MTKDNTLIYGMRPVIEAIGAGKEIDRLMLQQGLKGELLPELRKLINEFNIPFQYVPVEKLNRLVKGNHQGVVCFVSPIIFQPLENLLLSVYERGETPFFIILDRITDVRNLGAIARSAECAGAHGLIIPEKGSAPVSADAVKTSAGALANIPVHRSHNLKNTIDYLKSSGLSIVAASEKGIIPYYNASLNGPVALIMGSEEDGVSHEYLKKCDQVVNIPMKGSTGSLNVSVAAGILLFEALRQQTTVE
ncbi:putative TrmH family tRNA/rRNA methyltransferase [bioreactor metagenome]|jgi:23S rRNA (guanosine2251-2'-O)-methyltransferase|uniref:Putative TrmH family tRNA/rRNA methyltransferase n=1 Tax=bioreactor metagenome TaxID=1076179 RepID=A0A644U2H6_9ZZZZ|nr:23S rRNA (guanosine(2251)-2'-O)-methyltransferase RlmB [Lentimicrobium sp.]MEA5109756.1 23S rRNA (guanosine(2251)-2'-O)-methyltransferase RlmB [Lentimicrobium sp.]